MVCLSVYTYIVEVYTGELENAGTEANVSLMLVGRRGDTGHRKLLKSLGFADKKFQPGQVCCICINSLVPASLALIVLVGSTVSNKHYALYIIHTYTCKLSDFVYFPCSVINMSYCGCDKRERESTINTLLFYSVA